MHQTLGRVVFEHTLYSPLMARHRRGYLFVVIEIKELDAASPNDYIEAIIYCAFLCTITTLLLKLKAF
jgi:hypothetical protein